MADMITPVALQQMLGKLPEMPVVTYVNSPASVKALSTICCTSANAVQVVNSLDSDMVLMAPDRNLAQYTAANTSKNIHIWNGFCPIHDRLSPQDVMQATSAHPGATFMAHPECRQDVLELADVVVSTSGMIRHASASKNNTFIVGTEIGLLHPLKKANPEKEFFPASDKMICSDMKKITLEDVARSLEHMEGEVKVPEDIRREAFKAVKRMVSLS
jgi:quinolinate synthase